MNIKSLLIFVCCFFCYGLQVSAAEFSYDHSIFDGLLKKHVTNIAGGASTQVDYAAILKEKKLLDEYLSNTAKVKREQFDRWGRDDQLAFLINNYNAWTVNRILEVYPNINSIKDLGNLLQSPWKKSFIPLLGETLSLDDIEHTFIRGSGRYQDPRIHFAVNCASIGCPAMRAEAYVGKNLNTQLDDQTQQFMRDRSRNFLKDNTLYVSAIFKWYAEDFAQGWRGIDHLNKFFLHYSKELGLSTRDVEQLKKNELKIKYNDYDWQLNSKKS